MGQSQINFLRFTVLGILGLLAAASQATAQANLIFTGTEGVNFTVRITAPITYKITENYGTQSKYQAPTFVFKAVGNDFTNGGSAASGNVSYSVNGESPNSIQDIYSGQTIGNLGPNDAYIWGYEQGVAVGDSVTLSAGTFTTYGGPRPANGSYVTYIMDGNGLDISTNGVSSIPEPASFGLLCGCGIAMLGRRKPRNFRVTPAIHC